MTNLSNNKPSHTVNAHNENLIANARAEQLKKWIEANKHLLAMAKSIKIDLSIKETSIRGSITQYPDS